MYDRNKHVSLLVLSSRNLTNMNQISKSKFSDAGIQNVSKSISIKVRIQKNIDDLTERCEDDDDQSDKHLQARDSRCSSLIKTCNFFKKAVFSRPF